MTTPPSTHRPKRRAAAASHVQAARKTTPGAGPKWSIAPGDALEGNRSERLRAAIRALADEHRLNLADFARRVGLKNANLLHNFLSGGSADLSRGTLERICNAFPPMTLDELVGRRPRPGPPSPPVEPTPPGAGPGVFVEPLLTALSREDAMPPALPEPSPAPPAQTTASTLDELSRALGMLETAGADVAGTCQKLRAALQHLWPLV